MNKKNNFINSKTLLVSIVYVVIFTFLTKYTVNFNTTNNNKLKEYEAETKVSSNLHISTLSEQLPYSNNPPSSSYSSPTLSRGYTDNFSRSSLKLSQPYNYEEDFYALRDDEINSSYYSKKLNINSNISTADEKQVINSVLPDYFMYRNVNITSLRDFLKSRNSLLVEEPYFSTILSVCKDFNINPLVMFAITGQEQSFVPKNNKNAYKIANNPFNVFRSWKEYNTDIKDSTTIAINTIVNIYKAKDKDKPKDKDKYKNMDDFTLINEKYCEDKNWSKCVRSIFKQLESKVSYW